MQPWTDPSLAHLVGWFESTCDPSWYDTERKPATTMAKSAVFYFPEISTKGFDMSEYQTGQIVTVTGAIERHVGMNVPIDTIAIGEKSDNENYAGWIKHDYHPAEAISCMVLGYTYKLAGVLFPPSQFRTWDGYEEDSGGINIAQTGKAWIVMPVDQLAPNRYRKPITTIEEFMTIAEADV